LQPAKIRAPESVGEIAVLQPDLLVVMAYGQILPQALLDVPPLGALNLHASLLPRHRGAAPVHAAVLAGDDKSGITVMWMDAGLDTGNVLLRAPCPIESGETAGSLHDKLADLAPQALAEALALVAAGRAPREPQDHTLATYAPKLDRSLGVIDWKAAAADIERNVRGLHPWPGCSTEVDLEDAERLALKIHRVDAREGRAPAGTFVEGTPLVGCGGGGLIELLEVQPAGGRRMGGADFLRGHRVRRVSAGSGPR
jgi:methionyl-tRNA formyltransferase